MLIAPPVKADYGFYNIYIDKAPDTDLISALNTNLINLEAFADSLSDDELLLRYEPGKWSIKEILVHLIDSERNFCYRIMRISRGDQGQLPMFNIHDFVVNSSADERDRESIMQEMMLLRKATMIMFKEMPPSMLDKTGPARDITISVRALGFAIVGHVLHHMDIIKEKYFA